MYYALDSRYVHINIWSENLIERPNGRPGSTREDNIKISPKTGWEDGLD